MSDRRHLTLWEALVWVYCEQKAHLYLKHERDWVWWAWETAEMIEDMPRPLVHRDAATIHGAVVCMGWGEILITYAAQAHRPMPSIAQPRPYPVIPSRARGLRDGERRGWARFDGQRGDYLIATADVVRTQQPVYEKQGKRWVRTGYTVARTPVEYCPLEWTPDPTLVYAQNEICATWRKGMMLLWDMLKGSTEWSLEDHELTGLGLDEEPQELPAKIINARTVELDSAFASSASVVVEHRDVSQLSMASGLPVVKHYDRRARAVAR